MKVKLLIMLTLFTITGCINIGQSKSLDSKNDTFMKYKIHVFLANASAPISSSYPEGEVHPVLIYCRREIGSELDFDLAIETATELGWSDAEIIKGKVIVRPDPLHVKDYEIQLNRYQEAMKTGNSILIYGGVFND